MNNKKLLTSKVFKGEYITITDASQYFWLNGELVAHLSGKLGSVGGNKLWLYAPPSITFKYPYLGHSLMNADSRQTLNGFLCPHGAIVLDPHVFDSGVSWDFCMTAVRLWAHKVFGYPMAEDEAESMQEKLRATLVPDSVEDVAKGFYYNINEPRFFTRDITHTEKWENGVGLNNTRIIVYKHDAVDYTDEEFKSYLGWVGAKSYLKVETVLLPGATSRIVEAGKWNSLYEPWPCGGVHTTVHDFMYSMCSEYTVDGQFKRCFLVPFNEISCYTSKLSDPLIRTTYLASVDAPFIFLDRIDKQHLCANEDDPIAAMLSEMEDTVMVCAYDAPLSVNDIQNAAKVYHFLRKNESFSTGYSEAVFEKTDEPFKGCLMNVLLGSMSMPNWVATIGEEDHRRYLAKTFDCVFCDSWSTELLECLAAFTLQEAYESPCFIQKVSKAAKTNRVNFKAQQLERFKNVVDEFLIRDGYYNGILVSNLYERLKGLPWNDFVDIKSIIDQKSNEAKQ